MKKVFTSVVTALTVFVLGAASVFAASSSIGLVELGSCTNENGDTITYTVTDTTIPLITTDIASDITGTAEEELAVVWQKDLTASELPATFTFNVSGTEGKTVYIFHWTGSAWELVGSCVGPAVTATFTSLSPVAFVVDVQEASNSSSSSSSDASAVSPRTGNNMAIFASIAVICVAGSAAYVVATKKA